MVSKTFPPRSGLKVPSHCAGKTFSVSLPLGGVEAENSSPFKGAIPGVEVCALTAVPGVGRGDVGHLGELIDDR